MRIHITSNLVCERRRLDQSRLKSYFLANNCQIVDTPGQADRIIIVTCAFHKSREEQCVSQIQELSRHPGQLIVLGCLPGISPEVLKQVFHGEYLATKDLDDIDRLFPDFKVPYHSLPDANSILSVGNSGGDRFVVPAMLPHQPVLLRRFWRDFSIRKFWSSWRFFDFRMDALVGLLGNFAKRFVPYALARPGALLRIAWGCPERCAYCAIRSAIGPLKSKPLQVIESEYEQLLQKGHRTVQIVAENPGAYGLDIKSSLLELLAALARLDDGRQVVWSIHDIHPRWVIDNLITLQKYVRDGHINELDCSIESGSDRILQLMNRRYTAREITEALLSLKRINPRLRLMSDIIVGFPTETDDDFQMTIDALSKIGFDAVQVFPFSDRVNSIAARMEGKTERTAVEQRLTRLFLNRPAGVKYLRFDDSDILQPQAQPVRGPARDP